MYQKLSYHKKARRRTVSSTFQILSKAAQQKAYKQDSPLPLANPRDAEAQRMLNIPFLLFSLAAEYRSHGGYDQQLSDDHQKFTTLTGELS